MIQQRAAGAIMGALIGDALGLGCHWYYDLDEMRRDCGAWVDGYLTPRPGRYHEGMRAGELSQSAILLRMLLHSVLAHGEYSEADFTRRLDEDLLPQLDGTPFCGPGGYTNQSIREAWRRRVREGRSWQDCAGHADTTEGAERAIVLAALHARRPRRVAEAVSSHVALTQGDEAIIVMSTAYNIVLSQLIAGQRLGPDLVPTLLGLVHDGELPFHAVTRQTLQPPRPGEGETARAGTFSSPDALLLPHYAAIAAQDPGIRIEPAWKAALVYGLPCAIYQQLPAAYYLASRFGDDYESAVLHAINGGGQNISRAMLTGALVGAQVGLDAIPRRFIDGLMDGERLREEALVLGALAERE